MSGVGFAALLNAVIAKHPDGIMIPPMVDADHIDASAHPDLAGIFAGSTQDVEGAAASLPQSGKQGIKVVGFDTAPSILTDIEQGIIQEVVVQEPLKMGSEALQQLVDSLNGKQLPRKSTPLQPHKVGAAKSG